MNLKDAKVLVTGGSTGIGYDTAKLLKSEGADVAICGRNKDRLHKAAAELDVLGIHADVSDEDQVRAMVKQVINNFGDYNVLVNNAAYGYFSPLTDIDTKAFSQQLATNITGAMLAAKYSAKHFIEKSYGNIINISSTAGGKGFAGGTPYVASKFALGGMTQSWAYELRKHNIRVMQINPSEVLTQFAANAGYDQKMSDRKLQGIDIAHAVKSVLTMEDRGFVTDLTVWATNPE